MKMGTIPSPFLYDAGACDALQSVNLRRPAILHYALWAVVFPISQDGRLPIGSGHAEHPGIDVMGQKLTAVPGRHVALPKTRTTVERSALTSAKAPGQFLIDTDG